MSNPTKRELAQDRSKLLCCLEEVIRTEATELEPRRWLREAQAVLLEIKKDGEIHN